MKKFYLLGILLVILGSAIAFTSDTNPLVGRWEYTGKSTAKPFKLLAIFRSNGTFDGFINKKEFVSGAYHIKHDTLYISDPVCNAKYDGTYKVEFLGQQDSLRFHVIQDTCVGRREGTDNKLFKKVTAPVK